MKVTQLEIPGVLLIEPKVFGDQRGFFVEQWQAERYAAHGMARPFVQTNLSRSAAGVLRGLHYQEPHPQAKLVSVPHGKVLDVAVDIRVGSPTFGKYVARELSAENQHQLYVPRGCAHGFCVLSEWALLHYMCDDVYRPDCDHGLRYDDPDIGINWPNATPVLSEKDAQSPRLRDVPPESLPRFEG